MSPLSHLSQVGTQNMIFSVTYYLELCNAIIVYCTFHFLPTMVKLVVYTLENINILLDKNRGINDKKI